MNEVFDNTWGYIAGGFVWFFDHWSGCAALTLFILQAVYTIYKIKKVRKECQEP